MIHAAALLLSLSVAAAPVAVSDLEVTTSRHLDVTRIAPKGLARDGTVDWAPYIQAAVDEVAQVTSPDSKDTGVVTLPPGRLRISSPIVVHQGTGPEYGFASVEIRGSARPYGSVFSSTVLVPDFDDDPALVLHHVRAVRITNLAIQGPKSDPTAGLSEDAWFAAQRDMSDADWAQGQRTDYRSPHAGIVVDPFHVSVPVANRYPILDGQGWYTNASAGGSRQIRLDHVDVRGFVVGLMIAPSAATQNADDVTVEESVFDNTMVAVAVGQSQSRNVRAIGVQVHNCRTAFDAVSFGVGIGDFPSVYGAKVSFCRDVIRANRSGGGQNIVMDLYSEGVHSIGYVGGGGSERIPFTIIGSTFKFWKTPAGQRRVDKLVADNPVALRGVSLMANGALDEPLALNATGSSRLLLDDVRVYSASADHGPILWVNGSRDRVEPRGVEVSGVPQAALLDRQRVIPTWSNTVNEQTWPGTRWTAWAGSTPERYVSPAMPLKYVGAYQATASATDGTATVTVDPSLVVVGDLLWSLRMHPVHPGLSLQTIVGKVRSIDGAGLATLDNVPDYWTSDPGPQSYYVAWLPRLHSATTGTIYGDEPSVVRLVSVPSAWRAGEWVRAERADTGAEVLGTAGCRIVSVDNGTAVITLSKPATGIAAGQQATVHLYDAELFEPQSVRVP